MTGRDENVVILFRGGRLPEWHQLDEDRRTDYERRHVDLMLSVADRHSLIGIHGYRLLGPRGSWERFWTIEFPDLARRGDLDVRRGGTTIRTLRLLRLHPRPPLAAGVA